MVDIERYHPSMTKAGFRRLVRAMAAFEDEVAGGNSWGPERDAWLFANIVIDGLRKAPPPTLIHKPIKRT